MILGAPGVVILVPFSEFFWKQFWEAFPGCAGEAWRLVFVDPVNENEGSPVVPLACFRGRCWGQNGHKNEVQNGLKNRPTNKLKNTVILAPFELPSWSPKASKIAQENH